LIASFEADEAIRLDTTYTSKVVVKLAELITSDELKGKNILYWHTFSPAAMQWGKTGLGKGFASRTTLIGKST
jgi:hypothetical protein